MRQKALLDFLLEIPREATEATVMGVTMEVISKEKATELLEASSARPHVHECYVASGHFLFVMEKYVLKKLYKVM